LRHTENLRIVCEVSASALKPIRITHHARNKMRFQGVDESLVIEAIRAPDREQPSIAGRVNRWIRAGNRFVRVTCREERQRIVVISATFKRRLPR
jgi:hypothetical protein